MAINPQTMVDIRKLVVDADAFVAIRDENDSNHKQAIILIAQVVKLAIPLVTSDPAFGEAITVISQHAGLAQAIDFAEKTLNSSIEIIEVDPHLRQCALDIFKKQTSKNSRFTDCINMAIMQKMGLNTIFSFDIQYKKNKFKRLGIDR